jgi:glycosyltransferase involved in cell wall biosynthesis
MPSPALPSAPQRLLSTSMRILALEPYYGGSHQAFLDGWQARSRHAFSVLTLPAFKWKWRMRHAAVTFAEQLAPRVAAGESWDVLWCSDMMCLASFVGLAPPALAALPRVAYFHENQLTYPARYPDDRDHHFAFTNFTTAVAAHQVWFNSAYHRDVFMDEATTFLKRMPDQVPLAALAAIGAKALVLPPAVELPPPATRPTGQPLHILWAARWEFDKAPDTFFAAVDRLADRGLPFQLSVIGERFGTCPPCFEAARARHAERIRHWGFQPTRADYQRVLAEADVIVSTAVHEYFGITVVEAAAAGCFPLVPNRLAYPEVLNREANRDFFHDGTAPQLADRLAAAIARHQQGRLWPGDPDRGRRQVERYGWPTVTPALDDALDALPNPPPSLFPA